MWSNYKSISYRKSYYMQNEDNENALYRDVTTSFLSGNTEKHRGSCTIIIAQKIAKKYGIYHPSPVLVEGTDQGILIRKIEI